MDSSTLLHLADPADESVHPEPIQTFKQATTRGDIETLRNLLEHHGDILEMTLEYEFEENGANTTLQVSPLAFAAGKGSASVVNVLLEHGASAVEEIPIIGGTALHVAARYGEVETVGYLIDAGADLNQQDKAGYAPIHWASRYNQIVIVECLLILEADICLVNGEGSTPFMVASIYGCVEVLELLWEHGPKSQLLAKNMYGNQPLHIAVINDRSETVTWLLEKGASIIEEGQNGQNALHHACSESGVSIQTVEAILEHDESALHRPNAHGLTPILLACHNVRPEVLDTLIDWGALVSDTNQNLDSCYHMVVTSDEDFSSKHKDVIDRLHGAGADFDKVNRQGMSPLVLACRRAKTDLLEPLLEIGATINPKKGSSALLEASVHPTSRALEILLKKDSNVSPKNNHGLSALALACRYGRLENVRLLIRMKANILTKTNNGMTPFCIAAHYKHIEAALEILETREYSPASPLRKNFPSENEFYSKVITNGLLHGFNEMPATMLEHLQAIMYWAVRANSLTLVERCINTNGKAQLPELSGATWLHVAAKVAHDVLIHRFFSHLNPSEKVAGGKTALHLAVVNGTPDTAQTLLKLVQQQKDSIAKVEAILELDDLEESPLSLAVTRRSGAHKDLASIFWNELAALGTAQYRDFQLKTEHVSGVLETLARYERPGREDILKNALKQRALPGSLSIPEHDSWSSLDWAVRCQKPVVVWWLLSKGGYSSSSAINSAKNVANKMSSTMENLIQELLESPPPMLEYIPNPNDDRPPALPKRTEDTKSLSAQITVIDIHEQGAAITAKYAKGTVDEMIYGDGAGPSAVAQKDHKSLGLRDLEMLKSRVRAAECMNFVQQPGESPAVHSSPPTIEKEPKVRWIHLPMNKDLSTRLSYASGRSEMDHNILMSRFNRSWTELAAGAGHRYMKPQCEVQRTRIAYSGPASDEDHLNKQVTPMALYMPYLILGARSTGQTIDREENSDSFNEPIHSRNTRNITHLPITLDQFYYPVLQDTSQRDNDQVLSRYLEWKERKSAKRILMIGQLWLWILDEKTIITATHQTDENNVANEPLDIVLESMRSGEGGTQLAMPTSVHGIMESMLGVVTNFITSNMVQVVGPTPSTTSKLSPIDVFRESIKNIVNQQAKLFQTFLEELQKDTESQSLRVKQTKNVFSIPILPENPYHIIERETKLLFEIRDIRDELDMLKALAEHQETVWKQAFETEELRGCFQNHHPYTPTDVIKDLMGLTLEVDKAIESINSLLDLRTKQASIKDAEYGREQANDEARQSKIVFIFTIVTVIFLPLSFLCSLFALDVSSFPHESGDVKYKSEWIFPILCKAPYGSIQTRANNLLPQ
ncbi:hypothetical protein FGADI_2211 [Fusarium gaditjirri]|uniref:Ankyrin repeat protein n=1 Tax=Fusarium gaditjirri TaxID=282569 RepID=A0A8H4TIK1_9HYPO|nr:hypothetical protein FGADI_2211 [Fusarium gaditjirri]